MYVIYRLPTLKFLDSHEVTSLEREDASKETKIFNVVSYNDTDDNEGNNEEQNNQYTPLSNSLATADNVDPKGINSMCQEINTNCFISASFGFCRYVYYGKQSEGNRFIKNDDL